MPSLRAFSSVIRYSACACEAILDAKVTIRRVLVSKSPYSCTSFVKLLNIPSNSGSVAFSPVATLSFVASAYCWSLTRSSHIFLLVCGLHSIARCENQLSGAAPCQCSMFGAISTTSPGSKRRDALPRS